MENTKEIWRDVPKYPGYEVSDLGRLRSYHRTNARLDLSVSPHILTASSESYSRFKMKHKSGRVFKRGVHIVVLEAFVGPRPPLHLALHRNDDQADNRLVNLYWGTVQDNANDRDKNGIHQRGCDSAVSRFSEKEIRQILTDERPCRIIAREFNCMHTLISQIQLGKTYSNVAPEIPRREPKRLQRLSDSAVLSIFHDSRPLTEIGNDHDLTKYAVSNIKLQKSYTDLTKELPPDHRG